MVVAFHRFSGSRLSATVSPDSPHYGFAHAGRLADPPGLLHILATSSHPLPPPLASSGCSSCCAADRYSRGAAELGTVLPCPAWLLAAHGPARLARFPGSVSGTS